jgi:hypothetical protein
MVWSVRSGLVAFWLALGFLMTSAAAEEVVGEARRVTVTVRGESGELMEGSGVYRDETIRTSSTGVGEFQFLDNTKLAVGPNSTVVIDQFVYGGSSVQKLTLNSAKGTFRWISGKSKSSAYKIVTPLGTLGVRGTALDLYVGSGRMAIVLISGQASVCGNNGGCRYLKRTCDAAVVDASGVRGVARATGGKTLVSGVSNTKSFPFAMGAMKLSRTMRVRGGNCMVRQNDEDRGGFGTGGASGTGGGGGGNDNGPI